MIYIIQLIPNIWWAYSSTISNSLSTEDKHALVEFSQYNQIKQSISIDGHLDFWNRSDQYVIDVKKQLEIHEFQQMKQFMDKMTGLINNNYNNNKATLILSNRNNDVGLGIWVYFFNRYAEIGLDHCMSSIQAKMPFPVMISENLRKYLLIYLNG
jgi:hypothetical protein